ncbi:MAG: transporter substrate-binding domain-containing protein [Clostridiales Family XIII bacterium]|jgi:ABC-type amino acid transport substrate-binding protein|nr:transporter substrate-binding domain-containing protein [Clostridiales Family XIII bacterium]
MKRKIAILIAVLMVATLTLASCSGGGGGGEEKAQITSPADFAGRSVAVQTATTAADAINEMNEEGDGSIEVHEYEKVIQCFDDLLLDRVEAVYVDNVVASYYTRDSDEYEVTWTNEEGEPMGICIAKGNTELAAAVEAGIDTLYFTGEMEALANKEFGTNLTEGVRDVKELPEIPTGFATVTPGKLTVGSEVGYPPMEYTTDDGQTYIGFDIEFAKKLGELFGLEVEFVNTAWDGIFAGLERGQYDIIASSVSITPERQEKYILTKPYVSNALCIVTKSAIGSEA